MSDLHGKETKRKRERRPYFCFYGDDWSGGTVGFTLEQEGFYLRFVKCQWSRQADLPDDIVWLSSALRCDPRTTRRLRKFLLDEGKVRSLNGYIYNPRMKREIEQSQAKIGRIFAEDRPKIGRRLGEVGRKQPTKSNGAADTRARPDPDPDPKGDTLVGDHHHPSLEKKSSSFLRVVDDDDDRHPSKKISPTVLANLSEAVGAERSQELASEYLDSDYARDAKVLDRAFIGWLAKTYSVRINGRGAMPSMAEIIAQCGGSFELPKRVRK